MTQPLRMLVAPQYMRHGSVENYQPRTVSTSPSRAAWLESTLYPFGPTKLNVLRRVTGTLVGIFS